MDSENSFLGKLLMDYTSPISPFPSNTIIGPLMFQIVAHVQAATQYR